MAFEVNDELNFNLFTTTAGVESRSRAFGNETGVYRKKPLGSAIFVSFRGF